MNQTNFLFSTCNSMNLSTMSDTLIAEISADKSPFESVIVFSFLYFRGLYDCNQTTDCFLQFYFSFPLCSLLKLLDLPFHFFKNRLYSARHIGVYFPHKFLGGEKDLLHFRAQSFDHNMSAFLKPFYGTLYFLGEIIIILIYVLLHQT